MAAAALSSGTKKSGSERHGRVDAIAVEIRDALGREESVVDEELPVKLRAGLLKIA